MSDVKSKRGIFDRFLAWFDEAHVSQLTLATLVFGAFSLMLFWLTLKLNWLPDDLLPSRLTQENTGLFEALGGWALGFAGALVAIRIAGLATNIQQNDSIREEIAVLDTYVAKISELNSRITRATYDAKRACTAVLIEAVELYTPDHLKNIKPGTGWNAPAQMDKSVQQHLVEKLDLLIEVIEEASRDQAFRSLLNYCYKVEKKNNDVYMVSNSLHDYFARDEACQTMYEVVCKDKGFYDFIRELNESSKNLGVGINHLRSKNIYSYYRSDIVKLLALVNRDDVDMQYSDAAWLLLGILLLQNKDTDKNYNHGFLLISLILGSLPNEMLMKEYLLGQMNENAGDYTRSGKNRLSAEIDELSEQMYYLKETDLTEISNLFDICQRNREFLEVTARGEGLSKLATANMQDAKGGDSGTEDKQKLG